MANILDSFGRETAEALMADVGSKIAMLRLALVG